MMGALYRVVVWLAVPFVFGYFLWRARREPGYRRDWGQRLGFIPTEIPEDAVWVHTASVGEVQAIAPVIDDLLASRPDLPVVVTTMTPAGRQRVEERFSNRVHHCYIPLDLASAARRFLDRLRPRLGIIVEMELWPELLRASRQRGLPLYLVNARMSEGTLRSSQHLRSLFREALAAFEWIGAQSETDAQHLIALGAQSERVVITGNIKFDQSPPEEQIQVGKQLREALGAARPVWVAASTRDGEEEIVLEAFNRVRRQLPDACLILVPRHPQRFDSVARLVSDAGYRLQRRQDHAPPDGLTEVFLGDSVGEMGTYLAAADVAFVGGSLVPLGGQNMLEPAAIGLPVIAGPHRFNFQAVAELLAQAGGLVTVHDADELAQAVIGLLTNTEHHRGMATAARACVTANQGARGLVVNRLSSALDQTA